ncbi:agamous-like MADS-box protein AP1 [Silene latifolia]|uniref:agamous-like MADS-box protein AP1 n=1 Tax=Silene latifolia TaxID=37657 RepID=UPI003D770C24
MEKVLKRYERYCYEERQLTSNDPDSQVNWTFDVAQLKAKLELLHRNHRQYLGEDLDSLNNMKDIESLEQQLDTALKHIRSRKNQLMHESVSQIQKKVSIQFSRHTTRNFAKESTKERKREMQERNKTLARKIKERGKISAESQGMEWQQQQNQHQQGLPEASNYEAFHPALPSLYMRYY